MALIQYAAPWNRQPQEAVEVNRSVREPSVLLVPSVGLGNLATPGDLANVLNRAGVGPDGQYTDVRALVSTDSSLSSTSFSWYALFDTPSSLSTLECVLGRGLDSGTNNTGFGFHGKHTNAAYAGAFYVGSGYTIIGKPTGGALATDTRYSIGGTYDGTNGRGYHNGVKTVGPTAGTAPNTTARLVLNSTSQTADPSEKSGLYKFYAVLYWPFALSDAEMAEVHNRLWAYAFAPQTIPVPVSAGGGGTTGTAATTNANDTPSASGTTTVTGTSSKTNANDTSSASGTTTVVGTSAKTNANDASSASGTTTVIGTLAKTNADDTSAASGTVGSSGTTGTVAATNANDTAAASGTTKIVGTLSTTNANDAATASGVAGAVSGTVAVTNANDTASAVGDAGAPVASGAGMGFSMSRMRRLVKIQFNGKLYQAFEEDIPELLETLEEQAEQKIKKKRNARAKPAPVATVVSAPADVLPSLQSRIDDVNHSIGVLWGVDEDEDEELLWLML